MRWQLPGLAVVAALLSSCGSSTSPYGGGGGGGGGGRGATPRVSLQNFPLHPTPDTASVNTTVTLANPDRPAHTANSDGGAALTLDTGQLANGAPSNPHL